VLLTLGYVSATDGGAHPPKSNPECDRCRHFTVRQTHWLPGEEPHVANKGGQQGDQRENSPQDSQPRYCCAATCVTHLSGHTRNNDRIHNKVLHTKYSRIQMVLEKHSHLTLFTIVSIP
jgi:hypothetical protein